MSQRAGRVRAAGVTVVAPAVVPGLLALVAWALLRPADTTAGGLGS